MWAGVSMHDYPLPVWPRKYNTHNICSLSQFHPVITGLMISCHHEIWLAVFFQFPSGTGKASIHSLSVSAIQKMRCDVFLIGAVWWRYSYNTISGELAGSDFDPTVRKEWQYTSITGCCIAWRGNWNMQSKCNDDSEGIKMDAHGWKMLTFVHLHTENQCQHNTSLHLRVLMFGLFITSFTFHTPPPHCHNFGENT